MITSQGRKKHEHQQNIRFLSTPIVLFLIMFSEHEGIVFYAVGTRNNH